MRRHDAVSLPRIMLTNRVKIGIVVPNSVALTAVVNDNPFTNNHWLNTTPRRLHSTNKAQSLRATEPSLRVAAPTADNATAAPNTRKATRLRLGKVRKAILPSTGQVANMICTAMSAMCGAGPAVALAVRAVLTIRGTDRADFRGSA